MAFAPGMGVGVAGAGEGPGEDVDGAVSYGADTGNQSKSGVSLIGAEARSMGEPTSSLGSVTGALCLDGFFADALPPLMKGSDGIVFDATVGLRQRASKYSIRQRSMIALLRSTDSGTTVVLQSAMCLLPKFAHNETHLLYLGRCQEKYPLYVHHASGHLLLALADMVRDH